MNIKRLIIGAQLNYSLNGTAITNMGGAAVTGVSIKPDGTTPADWAQFATVEDAEVKVKETADEIMAPSPGAYRRIDQIRSSQMTDIAVTIQEVQELIMQALLRSGTITDSAAFTPGTTLGELRGWWQLLKYAQNDAKILDWQFYGCARVTVLKAQNKMVKPLLAISLFYNTLESGKSTLSAAA